jgi:hypothetical protein
MIRNSVYCSASVCIVFSIRNQKSVGNVCNSYFNSIILLIMLIYALNFVCCSFMAMSVLTLVIDFFLPLHYCLVWRKVYFLLLHRAFWNLYSSLTNKCTVNLARFKIYIKIHTEYRSYMFRSTTIIRELVLNLAKVIFVLKHSVKLHRYMLFGDVTACLRAERVLCSGQNVTSRIEHSTQHTLRSVTCCHITK